MRFDSSSDYFYKNLISAKEEFINWNCLNDSIMGGSRDLVEVFAGVSLNFYGNTSLEVFINNFIGDNVRNNVPIYSIRLKAFDIF